MKSFSGTHEFKRDCAIASVELDWIDEEGFTPEQITEFAGIHVDRLTEAIGDGKCPRCHDPLPQMPEYPAGSRTTLCRCIPICGACGADEAFQPSLGRPMSRIWEWPISKGHRTRRKNKVMENAVPATLDLQSNVVIDATGVGQIQMRPNPGGWAEYGFDDGGDAA